MADFFDKKEDVEKDVEKEEQEESQEKEETIEKIKVGKDEYTADELSSLVNLGKIGQEAEKKWGTPIDKVYPAFTKKSQELKELKEKAEADEKAGVAKKAEAGEQLSEEETVQQALDQAEKMGIATTRKLSEAIRKEVLAILEGKDLLSTCKDLETEISGSDGRPAFKTQDILTHMQETGIRNPEKAYKDKFETQIDKWKQEQLEKAKPEGLITEGASGAGGGKTPPQKKLVGEDALRGAVRETLWGKGE